MASRRLKSQWLKNLWNFWIYGVFFVGIGAYAGVMVWITDKYVNHRYRNLRTLILTWFDKLHAGNELVYKLVMTVLFLIIILKGVSVIAAYAGKLTTKQTVLGRSIMRQAAPRETLEELVKEIDSDMADDSKELGISLRVGAKWLLADEAMRLSRIREISWETQDGTHILTLQDEQRNTMVVNYDREDWLKEAVEYLQNKLPGVQTACPAD
ncbi:hypothetical protein [Pseudoflavonifractor phocaeensis]|uniref:hypothetical protein n=1 Tax=Pseudoflavonifractor phocaeensis TaxID=1870988 RepID=UPI00210AD9F8|nr:hypothetical protein [Pseudoflavonifractor phocaeensis]MCQ4863497.1 hypothetical protein [Pseudoflavonifractor phocaeensis]